MNKTTEALKLAEEIFSGMLHGTDWNNGTHANIYRPKFPKALAAIREVLAEPVQEPVAYRYKVINYLGNAVWTLATPRTDTTVLESQALYTAPPSSQRADALVEAAIEATRKECAELCDRFAEREMHPAECAAAIRSMK